MRKRFNDVTRLVEALLDRIEAGGSSRAPSAGVGEFRSVTAEDQFYGEIRVLEAAGGLRVDRRRIDGVEVVRGIQVADADVLYRHIGRTPSHLMASNALVPLRDRADLPQGAQELIEEVSRAWSRNASWETLRPGRSLALHHSLLLAEALASRGLRTSDVSVTDHRTFSRQVTGNSKSLERLQRIVVLLLRRLHPKLIPEGLDDDAKVLAVLGVERFSQPLLMSGALSVDDVRLPNLTFVGLPVSAWSRITVKEPAYMLLIENYASFQRHCAEINSAFDGLVIYTGGFPSQGALAAICGLGFKIDAPVYHWGDLDPGGLRIFVHLERSLAQHGKRLLPHLMSTQILNEHGKAGDIVGRPLKTGEVARSAIADIWDAMASSASDRTMEQEQLDPSRPT
jgi:hypothetical protein